MLYLVYVNVVGKTSFDNYEYEFYFSEDPDEYWMVDAHVKPASICNLGIPDKMMFSETRILKTSIVLSVVQNNSSFSFQDCKDKIVPVAWECIDDYDEYPDNRLVLPFGLPFNDTEQTLLTSGLYFEPKNEI